MCGYSFEAERDGDAADKRNNVLWWLLSTEFTPHILSKVTSFVKLHPKWGHRPVIGPPIPFFMVNRSQCPVMSGPIYYLNVAEYLFL